MITKQVSAAGDVERRAGPARRPPARREIDRVLIPLIAEHGAQLKRFALRYSLCREDADDAYQRGIEILITRAPTSRQDELVRWLHTVVKNEALAIRRKRERFLNASEIDDSLLAGEWRTPEEHASAGERVGQAAEAIQQLKPPQIRCLVLKACGYTYGEIAARNGWSWTKVNRLISEGRATFMSAYRSIEAGHRCERLEPLISALVDDEIEANDRDTLRRHLSSCPSCRARLREYRAVPSRVAGLIPPVIFGLPAGRLGEALGAEHAALSSTLSQDALLAPATESFRTYVSEPVAAALRAVRDGVRSLASQGADSLLGRAIAPLSSDPSGISTAAKVCAGTACVLIAGGAATVGMKRGHEDGERAAVHAKQQQDTGALPGRPAASDQAQTLSVPGQSDAHPKGRPRSGAATRARALRHRRSGEASRAARASQTQAGFEPDDSGAAMRPEESGLSGAGQLAAGQAGAGQAGVEPRPAQHPDKQSVKPPTGGSQEFQP